MDAGEAHDRGDDWLYCPKCRALWRTPAVLDAMKGQLACLLCEGPLTPVP